MPLLFGECQILFQALMANAILSWRVPFYLYAGRMTYSSGWPAMLRSSIFTSFSLTFAHFIQSTDFARRFLVINYSLLNISCDVINNRKRKVLKLILKKEKKD